MRVLASALDAAREGRVVDGPAVFPSPDDLDGAKVGIGPDYAHLGALTTDEVNLITSALDSHVYWQLSDEDNRNDGAVVDEDADADDEHADERKQARALESRLADLVKEAV